MPNQAEKPVTFFAAIEGKPSFETIRVHGGEGHVDGQGHVYCAPMKEAKFHSGRLTTSDRDIINTIRKFIADGGNYFESEEEFLRRTLPVEKLVEYSEAKLKHERKETNRLRAELEKELKDQANPVKPAAQLRPTLEEIEAASQKNRAIENERIANAESKVRLQ